MSRKKAGIFFLGTCLILAILLLTQIVTPIVGAFIFAVALVAFGVPSNGFRKIWREKRTQVHNGTDFFGWYGVKSGCGGINTGSPGFFGACRFSLWGEPDAANQLRTRGLQYTYPGQQTDLLVILSVATPEVMDSTREGGLPSMKSLWRREYNNVVLGHSAACRQGPDQKTDAKDFVYFLPATQDWAAAPTP
jgi:hypothetical protein